ncbi:MAG: cyclic nucleotide-binding domain-containing protein [Leptolyngbyaceae cyanobacterium RM1_1_2]|nr:cyclic nucleotide-binding domain-containing protein [Leptolyngbyaceae cyanobacterium RM1_1_2]
MTYTQSSILDVLKGLDRFGSLPESELLRLSAVAQPLRYRMGQSILRRETLPHQLAVLLEGQARLLGYDLRTQAPVTLKRLDKGELLGIAGLVRGIPCETVIASTEVTCLTLPAQAFLRSLDEYPEFGRQLRYQCHLAEAFDLLGKVLAGSAQDPGDLRQLIVQAASGAIVCYLPSGQARLHNLNRNRNWMISSGVVAQHTSGEWLTVEADTAVHVVGGQARLIGFHPTDCLPLLDRGAIAPMSLLVAQR